MSPAAKMPGARGLQARGAQHAPTLADLETRALGQRDVRVTPAPTTTASAVDQSRRTTLVATTCADAAPALEVLELVAPVDSTPCDSSTSWKKRPACLPKLRSSVASSCITIVALLAHQRQRRRHLGADVGAADQHHVLGVGHALADRVCVAERAQIVDLLELAARHVQAAHVRASGDQGLVEAHLSLVGELGGARLRVERHDARAREQLDPVLLPPVGRPEQWLLATSPPRADIPSSTPAGCTAGQARAPRAGSPPRLRTHATSARSGRRPGHPRSAGTRLRERSCWDHRATFDTNAALPMTTGAYNPPSPATHRALQHTGPYNPGGCLTDQCAHVGM